MLLVYMLSAALPYITYIHNCMRISNYQYTLTAAVYILSSHPLDVCSGCICLLWQRIQMPNNQHMILIYGGTEPNNLYHSNNFVRRTFPKSSRNCDDCGSSISAGSMPATCVLWKRLPEYLDEIPLAIPPQLWFMHSARSHFCCSRTNYLSLLVQVFVN